MSTEEQLNTLLTWDKVHEWAKQHTQAPFLDTDARYQGCEALGISANPLFCPLACLINELTEDQPEWRVRKGQAYRYEGSQNVYCDLPDWARKAEELVDSTGAFIGITQEQFLAILEAVKPREREVEV